MFVNRTKHTFLKTDIQTYSHLSLSQYCHMQYQASLYNYNVFTSEFIHLINIYFVSLLESKFILFIVKFTLQSSFLLIRTVLSSLYIFSAVGKSAIHSINNSKNFYFFFWFLFRMTNEQWQRSTKSVSRQITIPLTIQHLSSYGFIGISQEKNKQEERSEYPSNWHF